MAQPPGCTDRTDTADARLGRSGGCSGGLGCWEINITEGNNENHTFLVPPSIVRLYRGEERGL